MLRKIGIILATAVMAAGLSRCRPDNMGSPKETTPIVVQLRWLHQAQFAGFYVAAQHGMYANEGLTVDFIEGGAGVDVLSPVLDGLAQFGIAGADELIMARARGLPVRAIATIYRRSPVVFISLADSGITRPQDFVGQTIRVTGNTVHLLHAMTAQVGVTPDQYAEVTIPSDVATFAAGDVSVWGVYLDGMALAVRQAGYKINIISPDDYGVHFYGDTLFTTDNFLAANPDLTQRFLRATLQGWRYAVEHPGEVGKLVALYAPGVDVDLENQRMIAMLPLVNTGEDHIGWMRPEMWANMQATLIEQGVLSSSIDVTQVYTLAYLEAIYGTPRQDKTGRAWQRRLGDRP